MSTSAPKPKTKKSVIKSKQPTQSSWKDLAGFSSDEDPSVDPSGPPQTPASSSRNPGILPNSSPIRTSEFLDSEDFEYERIKRAVSGSNGDEDGLELWVMRVPLGIKPKALEKLQVDLEAFPSSSSGKTQARVGTLARKGAPYDVWSVSSSSSSKRARDDDADETDAQSVVGGQEVLGMQCLLPRRRDGKVYLAPPMRTRHLVLSHAPALPTPSPSGSGSPAAKEEEGSLAGLTPASTPRYKHPASLLKHRFLPIGAVSGTKESLDPSGQTTEKASDTRDTVEAVTTTSVVKHEPSNTPKKKRKAEGKDGKEDKKKTKKAKTGS